MIAKFTALFAVLAVVNAGTILIPEPKIETLPVTKTSIVGPSGNITQEEHLPVISQPAAFVEPSLPLIVRAAPLVAHPELPLVHPEPVFPLHPYPVVSPQVPLPVHHEFPLVHPAPVVPVHPFPQVPVVVNPELPIHELPHQPIVIKTIPSPLANTFPYYYRYGNGFYYI